MCVAMRFKKPENLSFLCPLAKALWNVCLQNSFSFIYSPFFSLPLPLHLFLLLYLSFFHTFMHMFTSYIFTKTLLSTSHSFRE